MSAGDTAPVGLSTAEAAPVGLSTAEAERRRAEHGPNLIRRDDATPAWRTLLGQFVSPVIGLLAAAAVVAGALGEVADAIAIGAIVIVNGVVGFVQEHRAERALLALRGMTAPHARVVRDGRQVEVAAADVVPGDLLVLEAGDLVAADARLVAAHALATSEAALTGESVPVEKSTTPCPADAPLAERHDRVFMGTAVARGTGRAEVVATGMATELGRIAHLLATTEKGATPLERRLAQVTRVLIVLCLVVVALVAVLGLVRGHTAGEVFLLGVSLAVAAVPEGLPAVVTIALAVGVQRMVARHVLIRRLPAVETLGCATVICTDKTGTLTTGVMAVRELWGAERAVLLDAAAACCDAELGEGDAPGVGDPTELAILAAARADGIERAAIERDRPRLAELPFDTERKRMAVRRADGVLYVKGAIEVVAPRSVAGADRAEADAAAAEMGARGLRVLAVATGAGETETELTLLGLVGIADPPRPAAIAAVAAARTAGITTVMITGDHPTTAAAIAGELGIVEPGPPGPTGDGPDRDAPRVHARATPEDKLRIVREWKARGHVVAMTGDGVNDAPAMREADIGIAMGRTGTEVTREASDMVLTDDDFASIVAGIGEGRGIYENIRKTLVYLLTGNVAELAVMLLAALIGLPVPLLPLHLLWINLVTDGVPALALVMDPTGDDVLRRPPRPPDQPMLGRHQWLPIAVYGLAEAAVTLAVYATALDQHGVAMARTLAFSTLVFCELFRAFAARSTERIFWEVGAFTNLRLVAVVLLSAGLQLGLHQLDATRALFDLERLAGHDLLTIVVAGLIPVTVIEVVKLARRAVTR